MNPGLQAIPGSMIRAIAALKQPGDIDLGLGEPTLPVDRAPFQAAVEWVSRHGCPYTPNAGDPELRSLIASRCGQPGLGSPEHVCVTLGSQEALYLAIKTLCDPARDEVLVVAPCYPAYEKLCALEGVAVRRVSLSPQTHFAPDAARVLAAVGPATRLIVLASPANPTGRVWPDEALQALADGLLALGEARPWVVVDEVYRALCYVQPPVPLAARYDRTVVVNSLSKSHALTGLRLGWLLAPTEVVQTAVKAHQFVVTAASTFSQRVAHAILSSPVALDAQRPHYEAVRAHVVAEATRLGLAHVPPEGAFYMMLALPPHLQADSRAACIQLLEAQRVVTVPGVAFGAEGWLRLSWVAPREAIDLGLERIAAFFSRQQTPLPPA
ncbi:MAG: pyridoxal phosphate-dependent aminotransferase [Candidatus Sericytochromatia bacterium]|nr:pyridoxal phosphate-dependent aminotransferase [Candidatus Sericytochromatia bacterium]MEB3221430.1 pyridoxal phosphate-dependent aminotransferase [Candidatus Sericytochromatia bacterium]